MKQTNFSHYFLVALLACISFLAVGCSDKEKDEPNQVAVKTVAITTDPSNALRYPVEVVTESDCEIAIAYWPVGAPEKKRNTKSVATTACKADVTVMFVTPDTDYAFSVVVNGVTQAKQYEFHTSNLPANVPTYAVTVDNGGAPTKGYILQWQASRPGYYTFCDMDGNVVWYQKVDKAGRNGFYNPDDKQLYITTGFNRDFVPNKSDRFVDGIFSMDLYGNYDIQLSATEEPYKYSHHEFRMLPDGNLILVRNFIKEFDLSSFGLSKKANVYGDGYIVIDRSGKEIARWDNWEEYDPFNSNNRILEQGAVNDFLHLNCVNYDSEGYYYLTFNRIRQLWKVDPRTGKVIYRLGENGNVQIPEDAIPSGVHAAEPLAPNKVMVVDNGEERGFSRTLIYDIDPTTMTAKVSMSIDSPSIYSSTNRSNSELLPDGNTVMFCSTEGRACVFTDLQGNIQKVITRDGISYRAHYYEDIFE